MKRREQVRSHVSRMESTQKVLMTLRQQHWFKKKQQQPVIHFNEDAALMFVQKHREKNIGSLCKNLLTLFNISGNAMSSSGKALSWRVCCCFTGNHHERTGDLVWLYFKPLCSVSVSNKPLNSQIFYPSQPSTDHHLSSHRYPEAKHLFLMNGWFLFEHLVTSSHMIWWQKAVRWW